MNPKKDELSEREKRFCELYAGGKSGAEAAREAGYAPKSAKVQSSRLLTKDNVKEHLRLLSSKIEKASIASATEALETVTGILRDKMSKDSDRLKAATMILKASGTMTAPATDDGDGDDEEDEAEFRVYMPVNYRDPDRPATAIKIGDDIVPLPGYEPEDITIYVPIEEFQRYNIWRETKGAVDIADYSEEKQREIISQYSTGTHGAGGETK